jgi:hypothetical protein
MAVALLAITLAFVFLGGLGGLIVIGVVLIAALAISYRVVTSSERQAADGIRTHDLLHGKQRQGNDD